jgi:cyclic-di-GMP phosphodiesterase TipF (flagellum assembly factor)
MPVQGKRRPLAIPSLLGTGDGFIFMSIALVVAAVVAGLNVQLGLPFGISALTGMILFIGLAGLQAWRRGEAERSRLAEDLTRLNAALDLPRPVPAVSEAPVVPAFGQVSDAGPVPPPVAPASTWVADDPVFNVDPNAAGTSPLAPERPQFEAYPGVPPVPPGQSFSDYWPTDGEVQPQIWPQTAPPPEQAPVVSASQAVREDDVEMLQRRIKDMLYQVNAAEQARELAAVQPSVVAPAPVDTISASVDALQAAVHSMRERVDVAAVLDPPAAVHSIPAGDLQPETVRDAITSGRVDVFLEPILGLGDQSTQHYEVSIKLRGWAMDDLGDGTDGVLTGRGLLPLFDAARIERSAIVAEKLKSRGKGGAVFSRASGEALLEPDFTRNMQMDFVARPTTARQLILTFSQADIRSFRAAEQRAISALSALGFRFAIGGLTDLDMNFSAMAKAGFAFVKIDASVVVHGLAHPGGHVPASDVCRFLADQGFGLIVDGIENEEMLARLFGFGVLMGQGTLFGGARPVKADVVTSRGQAA